MVNTNKLKLTFLQQEILRVLYKKAGNSLNQRQLANHLKVSSPAGVLNYENNNQF